MGYNHLDDEGYYEIDTSSFGKPIKKIPPVSPLRKTAADFLSEGAQTYNERNKIYGDNYKHFGDVMQGLFPNGVTLKSREDFNRFGIIVQMASKMGRLCNMFNQGGHADSTHDLSVYAAILRELEQ